MASPLLNSVLVLLQQKQQRFLQRQQLPGPPEHLLARMRVDVVRDPHALGALHVAIDHKDNGGRVEIRYRTLEQLDGICARLSGS